MTDSDGGRWGFKAARVRRALEPYDRFFLLNHPMEWQSRVHLVVPASALVSAVLAASAWLPPLAMDDWIPPIDQILYPQILLSCAALLVWTRAQAMICLGFSRLGRLTLLRMLVVRLVCVAAILAPPLVFSASLRAQVSQRMDVEKLEAAHRKIIAEMATAKKYAALAIPQEYMHCAERIQFDGMESERRKICERRKQPSSQSSEADCPPATFCYVELRKLFEKGIDSSAESTRLSATLSLSASASETFDVGDEVVSSVVANCRDVPEPSGTYVIKALAEARSVGARIERWRKYAVDPALPRKNVRVFLYLLGEVCLAVTFLLPWMSASAIIRGVLLWVFVLFVFAYMGTMGWIPRSDVLAMETFMLTAGVVLAVLRFLPRAWLRGVFSVSLLLAPLVPVTVLWLHDAWYYGDLEPVDGGLFTTILAGFVYLERDGIHLAEPYVYLSGIALISAMVLLVGPELHRLRVAPR